MFITGVLAWKHDLYSCDVIRKEDKDRNLIITFIEYRKGKLYKKYRFKLLAEEISAMNNMNTTELFNLSLSISTRGEIIKNG